MRKVLSLLLFVGAFALAASTAWALPWEGWATTSETFTKEMKLGRQLFFNYESINAVNPGTQPGDVLWVKTESGDIIGQLTETDGTYPNWKTAVMDIPESLVFTTQKLVFSTVDLGQYTGPHWVFNGVSSPVPEPATLMLLAGGLLGLAGLRKRKA